MGVAALCIVGIIAGRGGIPLYFFIGLFSILIFVLGYQIYRRRISVFYLGLSILFFISFFLGINSRKQSCFTKELYKKDELICTVAGQVEKVSQTDYGYRIYLKKVRARDYGKTEKCIVYTDWPIPKGTTIQVHGRAKTIKRATNPGQFDLRKYYETQRITYFFYADDYKIITRNSNPFITLTEWIKSKLEKSIYSICNKPYSSALSAMLLGQKDMIDEELSKLFSACGIGHILAISGLHISLLGLSLYKLLKRLGRSDVCAMLVGVSFIILYGMMTGNATSTTRAGIMFAVAVSANIFNRTYDMLSAVSFAAAIMGLMNPAIVENSGFILSYMAVVGICVVNVGLSRLFNPQKKITKALVGSISIQLATIPVIMYINYELPVFSVFLNLLVIPLMTVLMYSGIAGSVAGIVNAFAGRVLVLPAVMVLRLYELLCNVNLKIPWAVWVCGKPEIWQLAVYYGLLALCLWGIYKLPKRRWCVGIGLALTILFLRFDYGNQIVFLDVGQGDGIFMKSMGRKLLLDCGSSDNKNLYENILEPFLHSKAVTRLDCVMITHSDKDHISGICELLKAGHIKVDNLLVPSTLCIDENYEQLIEYAQTLGTKIIYMHAGMDLQMGDFNISCLHPTYQYQCSDSNDYSMVLSATVGDFMALFTGDLPGELEPQIIEGLGKYNILKVAHHGSKYSTTEAFLDIVRPECAVISSGLGNSYGHPHAETLERLCAANVRRIYRTDSCGAVIVKIKQNGEWKSTGYL